MDIFWIVKTAVDRADPCRLLEHGAPSDEYDSESAKIAALISGEHGVEKIAEIMSEVFSRCFNAEFSAEMFIEAAGEIRREI